MKLKVLSNDLENTTLFVNLCRDFKIKVTEIFTSNEEFKFERTKLLSESEYSEFDLSVSNLVAINFVNVEKQPMAELIQIDTDTSQLIMSKRVNQQLFFVPIAGLTFDQQKLIIQLNQQPKIPINAVIQIKGCKFIDQTKTAIFNPQQGTSLENEAFELRNNEILSTQILEIDNLQLDYVEKHLSYVGQGYVCYFDYASNSNNNQQQIKTFEYLQIEEVFLLVINYLLRSDQVINDEIYSDYIVQQESKIIVKTIEINQKDRNDKTFVCETMDAEQLKIIAVGCEQSLLRKIEKYHEIVKAQKLFEMEELLAFTTQYYANYLIVLQTDDPAIVKQTLLLHQYFKEVNVCVVYKNSIQINQFNESETLFQRLVSDYHSCTIESHPAQWQQAYCRFAPILQILHKMLNFNIINELKDLSPTRLFQQIQEFNLIDCATRDRKVLFRSLLIAQNYKSQFVAVLFSSLVNYLFGQQPLEILETYDADDSEFFKGDKRAPVSLDLEDVFTGFASQFDLDPALVEYVDIQIEKMADFRFEEKDIQKYIDLQMPKLDDFTENITSMTTQVPLVYLTLFATKVRVMNFNILCDDNLVENTIMEENFNQNLLEQQLMCQLQSFQQIKRTEKAYYQLNLEAKDLIQKTETFVHTQFSCKKHKSFDQFGIVDIFVNSESAFKTLQLDSLQQLNLDLETSQDLIDHIENTYKIEVSMLLCDEKLIFVERPISELGNQVFAMFRSDNEEGEELPPFRVWKH